MPYIRQEDLLTSAARTNSSALVKATSSAPSTLLSAKPGAGPGPHRHPYDEIQFVREGRGLWKVNGVEFEGKAGDIFVVKSGEIHEFKAIGDTNLVQVDVHMNPRFIQEDLI